MHINHVCFDGSLGYNLRTAHEFVDNNPPNFSVMIYLMKFQNLESFLLWQFFCGIKLKGGPGRQGAVAPPPSVSEICGRVMQCKGANNTQSTILGSPSNVLFFLLTK